MTNIYDVLESGDYVILDTETTGLERPAEIIQIAIIDSSGKTLIDQLLKPHRPLPEFIRNLTGQGVADWYCAMEAYAALWGEVNLRYGTYKWQKLTVACAQQGITVKDAHNALGDARMTLALCKVMLDKKLKTAGA